MVLVVRMVRMSLEMRERWPETNSNVHEPRPHERGSALHGSVSTEDGLQHRLSR